MSSRAPSLRSQWVTMAAKSSPPSTTATSCWRRVAGSLAGSGGASWLLTSRSSLARRRASRASSLMSLGGSSAFSPSWLLAFLRCWTRFLRSWSRVVRAASPSKKARPKSGTSRARAESRSWSPAAERSATSSGVTAGLLFQVFPMATALRWRVSSWRLSWSRRSLGGMAAACWKPNTSEV